MKKSVLTMIAALLAAVGSTQAQVVFTHSFGDVVSGSSGLTSAGGETSNVAFSSFSAVGTPANPNAGGRFSFTDWSTGATDGSNTFGGVVNTSEYYEVTITPNSGFSFDLNSFAFTLQRSGTGIRQYSVRSSLDGYASNLNASINPANTDLSIVSGNIFQVADTTTSAELGSTITLGASYDALTFSTPVSFRFYGFNSEASTGTFSIDDVAFSGTVSAVPEPSAFVLIGLGLCALGILRRRKLLLKT